jgi:hypothetical protein
MAQAANRNDFDDLRRRADVVRELPLETVLGYRGAVRDRRDKAQWHTEQGPLSVTGSKFMNWHQGTGGGGAIDLIMHLAEVEYVTAVLWLEQHVGGSGVPLGKVPSPSSRKKTSVAGPCRPLRLPVRDDRRLSRVREYLTGRRHLDESLVEQLIDSGKLYADRRANAVFLLVAGKANRPVGAELRGTGWQVWRGMAAGTRKDLGYFWIGAPRSRTIVLCESAIDAISCFQMHLAGISISTAGVRANPRWLNGLIARGYQIYCGFDTDPPGDDAAAQMMVLHPSVQRFRPPLHDWNDALAAPY